MSAALTCGGACGGDLAGRTLVMTMHDRRKLCAPCWGSELSGDMATNGDRAVAAGNTQPAPPTKRAAQKQKR